MDSFALRNSSSVALNAMAEVLQSVFYLAENWMCSYVSEDSPMLHLSLLLVVQRICCICRDLYVRFLPHIQRRAGQELICLFTACGPKGFSDAGVCTYTTIARLVKWDNI
jgi:hypothetical protein